jgi:hypothetical protein
LDGYHRLNSQIVSNTTQGYNLIEYFCDSWEQVHEIYRTIDIGTKRHSADIAKGLGIHKRVGLSSAEVARAWACLDPIKFGWSNEYRNNARIVTDHEKEMFLYHYLDATKSYLSTMKGFSLEHSMKLSVHSRMVQSVGIILYHFAAKEYGEHAVNEFYKGAFAALNLERADDPRRILYQHMTSTKMLHNVPGGREKHTVSSHYRARAIAGCWNAWVDGRTLTRIQISNHYAPIKINGTPWDGNQGKGNVFDCVNEIFAGRQSQSDPIIFMP